MAVRKIRLMGDPCLYQKSRLVEDVSGAEVQNIIQDMKDTLREVGGCGLAAPQIGASYRIVLINISGERANRENCDEHDMQIYVNPVLDVPEGAKTEERMEACLSAPYMVGKVSRYKTVQLKALDEFGQPVCLQAEGFLARVLQHEIDHLDGILYWTKIADSAQFGFFYHLPDSVDIKKYPPTEQTPSFITSALSEL